MQNISQCLTGVKWSQRVPLGQAAVAGQTGPDLPDLEVFQSTGRAEGSGPRWRVGEPIGGVPPEDWRNHCSVPHPTSLFYLGAASCSFWTCFWRKFPDVHQFQTNHLQVSPCRNFRVSRGWVALWCAHKISLQAPVQTIQQCTEVISVNKHMKYTHKSTCLALVLACLNCELWMCLDQSCV